MTTVACPKCGAWNPPQTTRCRKCGEEMRGPQIAFRGPPPGSPRPRSPEEERAAEQQRATSFAEAKKAERERKKDDEGKRRAYLERKERLRAEAREEAERRPGTSAEGPKPAPRVEQAPPARVAPAEPPAARRSRIPRVPTHVAGLDDALGGGIPAGYVIVLGGAPGTMKSSLAFWIVAHNCANGGRRALYVSCEETTGSLLRQMEAVGLDLDAAARGVKILDPTVLRKVLARGKAQDWLAPFQAAVVGASEDGRLDFLVIDSLEALEVLANFRERRHELFRLFEWLRDLALTTFVIAERPDYVFQGTVLQGRHEEDFLADGVLSLRLHPITDQEVQRRLRVMKMRGTQHETGYLALHVGGDELQVGRVLST